MVKYLITFLFLCNYSFSQKNAETYFGSGYQEAISICQANKNLAIEILNHYHIDIPFAFSIVFPEMIRYSQYKDFVEIKALEIFYIHYGSGMADFSIGLFQLKPSFCEKIEKFIDENRHEFKQYQSLTYYSSAKPEFIRKKRLERIKSVNWQLVYHACFIEIMNYRIKEIRWKDINEKLSIYATAYNHSFLADIAELRKWNTIKTFPNGMKSQNEFSYSEVSVYFFNNQGYLFGN